MTVLDAWWFTRYSTLATPLGILFLELIVLLVLSRRFAIPEIRMLLDKAIEFRRQPP